MFAIADNIGYQKNCYFGKALRAKVAGQSRGEHEVETVSRRDGEHDGRGKAGTCQPRRQS